MIRILRENSSRSLGIPIIILVTLVGVLTALNSKVPLYLVSIAIGVTLLYVLIIINHENRWRLWLGVILLSAFGPLLDILSGQPINWLIGLFIIVLFVIDQFFMIGNRVLNSAPRKAINKPAKHRYNLPPLTTVYLLYNLYFFLQALRPDNSTWNGLMAFRIAVIGLAACFLTFSGFRNGTNQDIVVKRVQQFLLIFMITGLIVAAYGIFQYLVGFDRLQAWGLTEAGGRYLHNQRNLDGGTLLFRIFGTLRRNETMGIFMYFTVVASVVGIRFRIQPGWLPLVCLLSSFIAMLLTLSLTSIILFILWIFLFVLINISNKTSIKVFGIGFVGFLMLLLANHLMNGIIQTRIAEHVLDTQEEIGRVKMAQNWLAELGDRPFFTGMLGTGICTGLDEGSLSRIQNVLNTIGIRTQSSNYACGWSRPVQDNWYATHSLEIGWLGLTLYWSIFLFIVISTLPKLGRRWPEPYRSGWRMLALGMLAIWPSGFVGALIGYMPIMVYFWSFIALLEIGSITPPARKNIPVIC